MTTQSTIRDKSKIIGLLVLLGVLAAPIHAHALTASEIVDRYCGSNEKILVNTFDDHEDAEGCTAEDCSLREAVNAANLCPLGSPGKVQLRNGTYALKYAGFRYRFGASGYSLDDDYDFRLGYFDIYLPIRGDVSIYGAATIKPYDPDSPTGSAFNISNHAKLRLRKKLTIEGFRTCTQCARSVIGVAQGGFLILNYVTLRDNAGARAIDNAGDTRIIKSTLTENVFSGLIHNTGLLKISFSTISDNYTGHSVLYNRIYDGGKMVVQYSTISGNHHRYGAIVSWKDTDTRIVDSTIVNNHASENGYPGGIWAASSLEVSNSIIANNTPLDCRFSDPALVDPGFVSATSRGTNLDSDGSCAAIPELNFTLSMDPMLEPLAYNKGPNQTHMPVWGSPVIDAGDTCKGRDQLSQVRPVDGNIDSISRCDIGAVEFQPDYTVDVGPLTCAVSVGGCDDSQISTGNNPPDFGL